MLIARPALAYAIACSSFPRRPIALLNAYIIPSFPHFASIVRYAAILQHTFSLGF